MAGAAKEAGLNPACYVQRGLSAARMALHGCKPGNGRPAGVGLFAQADGKAACCAPAHGNGNFSTAPAATA